MSTQCSYLENTYLFKKDSLITGFSTDDQGQYVILSDTIFYPQGGGQPADKGTIQIGEHTLKVSHVKSVEGEIRHYTEEAKQSCINQTGHCQIDQNNRLLHAKLHSGGHLIANVIEKHCPDLKAIKGHHFPNECYVLFKAEQDPRLDLETINAWLEIEIAADEKTAMITVDSQEVEQYCPNLPYKLPEHCDIRLIKMGHFGYQPCGGTHINSTAELQRLKVTHLKFKKKQLKISYTIE